MKFIPKSKDELLTMGLLKEGIYDFEVIAAKDKISKKGNEMLELQIKVWDDNGREVFIYDYLLEAMAFKLRHFAEETGLISKYEKGELHDYDCVGRTGKVHITVQASQMDESGNSYPPKNSVKDYVVSDNAFKEKMNHIQQKAAVNSTVNDDLPF